MTSSFRAACVQMTTIDNLDANIEQALALIEEAVRGGAEFIATPENTFFMRAKDSDAVPLYSMEQHPGITAVREAAQKHSVWVLIGSVFVPSTNHIIKDGRWKNRSVMINPEGEIVTHYDKIHLFDASFNETTSYRESARICPGDQVSIAPLPWGKMGLTICYDVRFPHLYRDLAKHGVELLAIPAAFAHITGEAHWHILLRARAIENGAYVFAPAQCGRHPGNKHTYGHAMIVNPWGEIIAEAAQEPGVIYADIQISEVQRVRRNLPTLQHDRAYLPPPDYVI